MTYIAPAAPRLVDRQANELVAVTVRREIAQGPQLVPVQIGQSCDGRPVAKRIGAAADCSPGYPGQQFGLAANIGGMMVLLGLQSIPRPLAGTQGANETAIDVGGAAAAVAPSLFSRRRFVDTDGNLFGPRGDSLGSAPAYFKGTTYHVAVTSSPTTGIVAGSAVSLTAAASGGTAPYTYSWDFDDGTTATGASVSHAWAEAGFYVPVVIATDSAGTPVVVQFAFYAHVVEPGGSATAGAIIVPPRRDSFFSDTGGEPWIYKLIGEGEYEYRIYSGASSYTIGYWDGISIPGGSGGITWDTEEHAVGVPTLEKNCVTPGLYPGDTGDGFYKTSEHLLGVEVAAPYFVKYQAVLRAKNIAAATVVARKDIPTTWLPPPPADDGTTERHLCAAADGSWWVQHGHRKYVSTDSRRGQLYNYVWDGVSLTKRDEVWLTISSSARVWAEFERLT